MHYENLKSDSEHSLKEFQIPSWSTMMKAPSSTSMKSARNSLNGLRKTSLVGI